MTRLGLHLLALFQIGAQGLFHLRGEVEDGRRAALAHHAKAVDGKVQVGNV